MIGKLKLLDTEKEYGIIKAGLIDYYFPKKDARSFYDLRVGGSVSFESYHTLRGFRARVVNLSAV